MLSEMHLAPSSKKRPKDVDIKQALCCCSVCDVVCVRWTGISHVYVVCDVDTK